MRRRSRVRRVAKWFGLVVCVLVAALWVFSSVYGARWARSDLELGCEVGRFYVWFPSVVAMVPVSRFDPELGTEPFPSRIPGWEFGLSRFFANGSLKRRLGLDWPSWTSSDPKTESPVPAALRGHYWKQWFVQIPFWCVLLVAGLPTAWLWWRDRRRPEGLCQTCGYDLTGNVSGVCSECGERIGGRAGH